jgi:hypothetical protein
VIARRPIPTPPRSLGTLRQEIVDAAVHRPEWLKALLLESGRAQPEHSARQVGVEENFPTVAHSGRGIP